MGCTFSVTFYKLLVDELLGLALQSGKILLLGLLNLDLSRVHALGLEFLLHFGFLNLFDEVCLLLGLALVPILDHHELCFQLGCLVQRRHPECTLPLLIE